MTTPVPVSRGRSRLRRPAALTALIGTASLVVIMIAGPAVWGEAAGATDVSLRLQGPSWAMPFGTDELGRDIFARVLVATRLSILLTLGATAISITGGILLGLLCAVLPRTPQRALAALIDTLLAFPWLLLVLFFSVIWGAGATGAMFAIGLAGIPDLARLVLNMAASVTGRDYVRAAKVVGVGPIGIVVRHILPNIANPIVVNAAAALSVTLLSFAGLSFLGLGVQPPEYDWGRLLNEGVLRIYVNPLAALGPGVAIVLAGLVFTMVSQALAVERGTHPAGRPVPEGELRGVTPARSAAGSAGRDDVAEVRDLRVAFPDGDGLVERVHGIDLSVRSGETLGIVGESGSGKTLTAMALAGLLGPPAVVTAAVRRFHDIDMAQPLGPKDSARVGEELAMVFQDPMTSLNPSLTIGRQLTEVPEVHLRMSRSQAMARALDAIAAVRIPEPERRLRQYPHELSGGMRQRAMIAMGLTGRPQLLVADEPTTALDVTVQRQVLAVLRHAQHATGAAIVFISHDIALVSAFCDRVVVMKDGHVVEILDAQRIREDATHPYTRALIACLPDMGSDRAQPLPVIPAGIGAAGVAEEAHAGPAEETG